MAATEVIHTAAFDSPIGSIRVATAKRGLVYVELPHANGRGLAGWLRRYAPGAECREGFAPNKRAVVQIVEFLKAKRLSFDLPLELRGTDFQLAVWNALRDIPYGETRTYQQVAQTLGKESASRAVGTACGANPVALVIPCHRVLRKDGGLGGYAWGLERKKSLLEMEQAVD